MEAKDESFFLSPVLERQGCDKEIRLVTYFNCKTETIFYPKILVAKQLPTLAKELFQKKKHIIPPQKRRLDGINRFLPFYCFVLFSVFVFFLLVKIEFGMLAICKQGAVLL